MAAPEPDGRASDPVVAPAEDPPVTESPAAVRPTTETGSKPDVNSDGNPAATTTTVVTTNPATPTATPSKYGASLTAETSVGIGTFVADPQTNPAVVTSFAASGWYGLAQNLKLTLGLSLTWYNALDIDTTLDENTVLMSDISLGVAHSRIVHDDASGFNLAGSIRVGLPTSLASQFQNRLFSLATGVNASIPLGPVTFSYGFTFGKYFNRTAVATLDCEDYSSDEECIEGRDDNPNFGFESERRGPEVYLRGSGANSYYFQNGINIGWAIVEGLDLSLGVTISNTFGVRSYPEDELSSEHAIEGRSQRDRLVSSLSLGYQFVKQLSASVSLVTDTSQPFGASGDDFPVIFDFSRAPDNITSISLSITGTL